MVSKAASNKRERNEKKKYIYKEKQEGVNKIPGLHNLYEKIKENKTRKSQC